MDIPFPLSISFFIYCHLAPPGDPKPFSYLYIESHLWYVHIHRPRIMLLVHGNWRRTNETKYPKRLCRRGCVILIIHQLHSTWSPRPWYCIFVPKWHPREAWQYCHRRWTIRERTKWEVVQCRKRIRIHNNIIRVLLNLWYLPGGSRDCSWDEFVCTFRLISLGWWWCCRWWYAR